MFLCTISEDLDKISSLFFSFFFFFVVVVVLFVFDQLFILSGDSLISSVLLVVRRFSQHRFLNM